VRLLRLPGVFRPPSDAWLLVRVMRERGLAEGARVLDVFTGSGVLAVAAAVQGAASVTALDISRRAVLSARINGALRGRRIRARRGDVFEPVRGERFDLITANPPYVPGEGVPAAGAARAWEGGADGRVFVDRLAAGAAGHLEPGGTLLMVVSSLTGEEETLAALRAGGLEPEVVARERGPLGPVVSERAESLERRGILAPGEREEEMLVIAARHRRLGGARA
jgi:release factor glutamine methyltransferase